MLNECWSMLWGNCTAQGGWQAVLGGGQWPARLEVDVEVVLACVSQGDRAQGSGIGDRGMGVCAGTLGGRDAVGTMAPRHPRGMSCGSGDANLQEETSGGGVEVGGGGHPRAASLTAAGLWTTCAHISRLGPSWALPAGTPQAPTSPSPQGESPRGWEKQQERRAHPPPPPPPLCQAAQLPPSDRA